MHGFSSGSAFLVNAEVDSMGGVVDGGVGIGTKPSPRQAAIEKAQAELRLEYDVREERRRELEFLERGGNPLDFKFVHAASLSVQSTSHTDQNPDQFLTSEAKGSFALTASPHGDSVESSGRLGVTIACEPNSADNFDGENELLESARKTTRPGRGSSTRSQHSSQLDGGVNAKESEDSPIFHPKKGQAYRRRNRSRISRDGHRSSSTDIASRGGHCSSLSGRHGMLSTPVGSENRFEIESDGTHVLHSSTTSRASEVPEGKLEVSAIKDNLEELQVQGVQSEEAPLPTSFDKPELLTEKENIIDVDGERPCSPAEKSVANAGDAQLNESSKMNGDAKCIQNEGLTNNAVQVTKGIGSESSCTQTVLRVGGNGNTDSNVCSNLKNVDSNGPPKEHEPSLGEMSVSKDEKVLNDKHDTSAMETGSCIKEDQNHNGHQGNGFTDKVQEEIGKPRSSPMDDPHAPSSVGEQEAKNHIETKSGIQAGPTEESIPNVESTCPVVPPPSTKPSCGELSTADLSASLPVSEPQSCTEDPVKKVDKENEDRILEEARIIKAKRKRIAELSAGLLPRERCEKSQWDFVLEEMAWLANDFAQERVWKMTAAAQICRRVAVASRVRLRQQNNILKQRTIAHTLANAVMDFWHSAVVRAKNVNKSDTCLHDTSSKADDVEVVGSGSSGPDKDKSPEEEMQSCELKKDLAIQGYAVRFLQYNCSSTPLYEVDVAQTFNLPSDIDWPEVARQDQFTEENLFYLVPPGAMETYRQSIESCLAESQRTGNSMQEEVDTSSYDVPAGLGYQENNYEEDEGENAYYLPGAFDTNKTSKKKRKNMKFYAGRPYELGADFGYGHCMENRNGSSQSALMGKRPVNSLHVGPIPTKRMRTASRQRLPFSGGSIGVVPAPSRADASSGDTNSFQDDHSTLHGGSMVPRGSEVDSAMDLEKLSAYDSTEISAKPKKKKKIKHQVAAYDHRWQLDSTMQNEQKDLVRKRVESHQLDSNGNSGFFGQHAKKPKIIKQSLDNSFDNTIPMSGSVASPVASQMSNMSNQSKIIKLIGGRDRGRKAKALKAPVGQTGSGIPWSLFEDQALVVLVHDMGPNWELVSDAINSTLQFKCIFRKPQECKERHKVLMDRTSGDGADSAEDSGSSQPYPSTLPGIPKGSARQLFQRLQGPMEEDTIKSHFEKIILIGQQLHYRKKQHDSQDLKQIASVHTSHMVALSQVMPNNVNGVPLTPLDLCDTASAGQEVLPLGFQGQHAGGLGLPNQGNVPSMHPSSGLNSSLQGVQGSPGMGIGNNLASSSSSQFNSPRYAVPRSGSLPIDEQQRLQQYNHMLPGRNMQPSNLPSSGTLSGNDRGVRVLPGGNGVGMMAGMSRNMAMPRPGLQGISSPSLMNSGSVLASNVGGMASNMGMHSGAATAQGNSVFRSRDGVHMVRSGQSSEHPRQMMVPDMQMQGTQPNSPGVPPFGSLSSGFPNQISSPSVQTYTGNHQQPHAMPQQHVLGSPHHPHVPGSNHSTTPEQQALLRIARDRHLQKRLMQQRQQQQQQQQIPASGALMAHVQAPPQLPLSSSSLPSNSQVQPQVSSPPVSMTTTHVSPQLLQQQQKHPVPPHGLGRNAQSGASGMAHQVAKQRQRQLQQSSRQHPQQRQQTPPQQQAKLLKGMGRGGMLMHQNLPIDPSHLNGLSANPGAQVAEKGEESGHLMQSQGLYSGSPPNSAQTSKPLSSPQASSHSQPQKPYANSVPTTSKQVQQIPSHLDSTNNGQVGGATSTATGAAVSNQGQLPSSVMPVVNHQQLQGQPQPSLKVMNQPHPGLQRSTQQSRQVNFDSSTKTQVDLAPGTLPACADSTNVTPVSSCPSRATRGDSSVPISSGPPGSIGSPPLTNSSGNEPLPSVSQGLGQRQLSGNLIPHGVGTQWQQQQSQLQQAPPAPAVKQSQQQPLQSLEQSPQGVAQQQNQSQIQVGQFSRPANSRLE